MVPDDASSSLSDDVKAEPFVVPIAGLLSQRNGAREAYDVQRSLSLSLSFFSDFSLTFPTVSAIVCDCAETNIPNSAQS